MTRAFRAVLVALAGPGLLPIALAGSPGMRFTETTPSCGIDWTMTSG